MGRQLLALIVLTYKEGVRDRALVGIGLFSLAMMGGALLIVNFFMRELHKVSVDINLSAIGFAGLLLTFFVSINLMSKDIDKKTVYCVLSKPFSRNQYVWGKYLGIMLLMFAAFCLLVLCSTVTIFLIKSQYGVYFKEFSWGEYYKAVYSQFLMLFILNAFIVFYSTITTSSFITLLFSISTYIAGQTIEEVVFFLKTNQAADMIMSGSVNTIISVGQYILPNLSVFDLKVRSAHGLAIPFDYLFYITLYAVIYSAVLLIASAMIFHRRELK